MALRYCFEEDYVVRTLKASKKHDLAVIDSDGIPAAKIKEAVKRGVYIYDYLNAGALESERSYYKDYKDLCILPYEGWKGEYWVDVTDMRWIEHLVKRAKASKALGCIGLYFDNTDIVWMCDEGFKGSRLMRKAPSTAEAYYALEYAIRRIRKETGLVVMPNGGDVFVRTLFRMCADAKDLIQTVNQEGVLYEDFKPQKKDDKEYRTAYLDWAKRQRLYIRGIEYTKSKREAAKARLYYAKHGWQGLYISKHKDLKGD